MTEHQGDIPDKPALAKELNRQGAALQERAEFDKALSCYARALALWREAAAETPGKYRRELYDSLLALGYFRIVVGQPEEGVAHWEEMLDINRELVDKGELPESALAFNLSVYGLMLERVRRLEDSLAAHLEALDRYRRLVAAGAPFVPGLARCLDAVGGRHASLNRIGEGMRFVEEALALVRSRPELQPLERDSCLSEFLANLAEMRRRTGEGAAGAELCAEAVRLARALAASDTPGSPALLAENLERQALYLMRENRCEEAAPLADESAALFRGLAEENSREYGARFGDALLNRGEAHFRLKEYIKALESFNIASSVFEWLMRRNEYAHTGKYLTSLCRLGAVAGALEQKEAVHQCYAKALHAENRFLRRFGMVFAPFVEDSFEKLL